jgi:hypothetical protein
MEARPTRPGLRRNPDTGVTELQEEFARLVAETNTLTEAYIRVYYTARGKDPGNAKPETIHNRAYITSRNPRVAKRIEHWTRLKLDQKDRELQARLDSRVEQVRAEELTNDRIRSFIREKAYAIATKEGTRDSDTLKALDLMGKLAGVGAFEKIADNALAMEETQANQRLKELITHLRQQGKLTVLPIKEAKLIDAKPLISNDKK